MEHTHGSHQAWFNGRIRYEMVARFVCKRISLNVSTSVANDKQVTRMLGSGRERGEQHRDVIMKWLFAFWLENDIVFHPMKRHADMETGGFFL
jgi:hypothetical protein